MQDVESGEDTQQPRGRENHNWTHRRNWGQRLSASVQYERFSALDAGGRPRIFWRFTLPPGQDKLDDAVYATMHEHKKDDDGYPTHLKWSHDRIHGKTWNIEDTERGRAIANRIDMALKAVAEKLEREQQPYVEIAERIEVGLKSLAKPTNEPGRGR
jgi:hypothetical protein